MHHLELNMSSIQQLWYPGTAKKPSEIFKAHISIWMCHIPRLRVSPFFSLPVKEGPTLLAPWNIPLAQLNDSQCFIYRFRFSVWRFAFCSIPLVLWQVHKSGFFLLRFRTSHPFSQIWFCCCSSCSETCYQAGNELKHSGQSTSTGGLLLWILRWLFFPPEHSVSPRSRLLTEVRRLLAFSIDSVYCHSRL